MNHNKVLIVEDEKLIATLLERRLNQFGYNVVGTTPSGEQAIEKAFELIPDLVLMDINLKGNIDGIEATIEIKKHLDIPVIYLTSYSDDETIYRAKASGPAGFLVKPIDEKELRTVLDITITKHEFECKLKETEEQYKALFDLSSDYFLIIEPSGNIKETNTSCLELLRYRKEELKNLKFDDLLAENNIKLELLIHNLSAEEKNNCKYNIKLKSKDGKEVPVEMAISTLNSHDNITSIICVAKNKIETPAVKAEELLREKEEALLKQNEVLNYLIKSYIPLKSDLMEVLREFTKVTTEALNINKAGVWLYNSDHTKMECLCLFDSSQDSYISGEIVHTVKYPSFFDTLDDESVIEAVNARVDMHTNNITNENVSNILGEFSISSSIHCGGEEIGVLSCEPTDMKKKWTIEEENFVTSIADLISLAFGEYERRNTIDLLETSEKKNKAIIDLIPDLMLRISSEYIFLDYKSDMAETLFTSPSQFLQKSCREVLPADLALKTEEYIRKTLETGEMQTFDYFLEINNEKKYFESRMIACGDDEVLAIIRDVTDQKRSEFALINLNEELENIVRRRTEELLALNKLLHEKQAYQKALLDSIPDVAWLKDSEGRYIAINKQLAQELDMIPEQIVGKTDFDLYENACAEKYASFDNKVLESGIPIRYEDELHDESGKIKWMETIKVPIFNEEGKIGGTAGTSRDITERKLTEELLEKSNDELEKLVIERTLNLQLAIDELREEINERKKIEDELMKLSLAVEQSPASIVITDLNGDIEYTNPKFSEITGYKKEEVIGLNPRILKSGEMSIETYKELWASIKSGKEWRGELHNKKKNGELFWENALIAPIKNAMGLTTHYLAVKEDITDMKNAENAVRESEKRFRLLYEKAPLSYQSLDIDGSITDVNIAWLETMGYTREETIGKSFGAYLTTYNREKFAADFQILVSNGELYGSEYEVICKDNSVINVQLYARSGYNNDGKFKQAYCILFNITERKRMESELIESEERFRTIFENSPVGISISFNSNIKLVNKAYLNMFGYDNIGDVIGKSVFDSIATEYRKDIINDMLRRMRGENVVRAYECYGIKKSNIHFPFYVELTYLDLPEGRAIVAFYTDMSEQKIREEQIKASLREKEILLKEIHHRVKNNLQIISSLLSLQSEYIQDTKSFSLFCESINRIKSMALIHERLYQSKNFSSIDFSEYVSDITNYLFRTYQSDNSNIKLNLEIEPVYIAIDSAIPCGFIINELVSNSLKYAFTNRKNGTIKISFKTDKNNGATLIVSDNGLGMPDDIDILTCNTLGLQLVNNLVEQLEGKIELKRGHGTKIIMKFDVI